MKTITIKKNNEFKKVYKKGKSIVGRYIVVYVLNNHLKINRIGITVSKKLGNAVKRNRARRVMKEAYRLNQQMFKLGYDIIIVGRSRSVTAKMYEVEDCLQKIMSKHNLMKEI